MFFSALTASQVLPCCRGASVKFSRLCRQRSRDLRTTERRLGAGGGGHYRLLEPRTVNSPQKVIRSYTPACAKPLVARWHCVSFYSVFKGVKSSIRFSSGSRK